MTKWPLPPTHEVLEIVSATFEFLIRANHIENVYVCRLTRLEA